MEIIWIIAIGLFVITLFFYWRISKNFFKNEVFSTGTWKTGETKLSYWQGAVLVSSGATILIIFVLKWANILTF